MVKRLTFARIIISVTIDDIQKICKTLSGVKEDIKWENHLCFNVGEKMFLITAPDSFPVTASFKSTDEDFDALSMKKGFKPSPYLARYKWIFIEDIRLLNKKEWTRLISSSYTLVASKLPKKIKKEIRFEET